MLSEDYDDHDVLMYGDRNGTERMNGIAGVAEELYYLDEGYYEKVVMDDKEMEEMEVEIQYVEKCVVIQ